MRRLRAFGRFWFDFVVGDDWRVLVVVVLGIVAVALLAHNVANTWWLLPLVVTATLGLTVARRPR